MTEILSVLEEWEATNKRHDQTTLGPSDTGACLRRSAYRLHGYAPSDEEEAADKARFGSLLHAGWSAAITALADPDHLADVRVHIRGLLADGHADDVDFRNKVVTDLKTTGDRAWGRWVNNGIPDRMWDQVELYAYGLLGMDYEGPWTLCIQLLNRETGQITPFERAADPEHGRVLAERLAERQQALIDSASPDDIDREGAGPDTGFPCDYCEFLTLCWPTPDDPALSPQAATIAEDPYLIELTLNDYLLASAEESKARRAKDEARAFLTGLKPETYGSIRLTWRGGNDKGEVDDPDAAIARLRALGMDVPTKRKITAKSINVQRVVKRAGE